MATPSSTAQRIAIVGGGISGLATAYYLMARARRLGARLDIQLFEGKRTLGGNADTVVVNLGRFQEAGGAGHAYLRWADLGVNDANLATYKLMAEVMTDIGYLQNMMPLQDTACYHDASCQTALTDDAALVNGVSDPRFNILNADGGLLSPVIQVVHQTALNLLGSITTDYTCARYFQDCIDDPRAMLSEAAQQLHITIDWDNPGLTDCLTRIRDQYYYPRISAMYFTDPRGPAVMPLQAPFEYYRLQEGGVTPHRCYFAHGSQTWLEALANHVVGSSDLQVKTTIRTGEPVRVRATGSSVAIIGQGFRETFDLCVMANHADDAASALEFDDANEAYGDRVKDILDAVTYTFGYAVCHTAAALLPANRNVWRTYNIPIRSTSDSLFPYRIDYVVNLHQNDPVNPEYDRAGLPAYFVSLVDNLNDIPREEMLDRVVDEQAVPAAWRDRLPQNTLNAMKSRAPADTGYRHQHPSLSTSFHDKAWTVFKHNVLNAQCIKAQADVLALNEALAQQRLQAAPPGTAQPPLLFGGGWTLGAGLQEQCLQLSQRISTWILPD